ncbi:MAG: ABC transporter permease [Hyphomicrobiales bacterium]|nr:ABC transporter permease [Hyphomicrobiales bacterium]
MPDPLKLIARANWSAIATFAIVLLLWELPLRAGVVQYQNLPPPSVVADGLIEIAGNGQLVADTVHTLWSVLVGWLAAVAVGVTLGLLLGVSKVLRSYLMASIEVLRPMPGIAFAPVALLLFGFSLETELMVIFLPALWPVLINTMGAVLGVHPRLFEVGRTFRLTRGEIMRKIMLPAALPGVLVGARLSMTLALVLAVVAEMVGNPAGLGYAVIREQQAMRPELVFAYVVAIGILGMLLNAALAGAAYRLFPAAISGGPREAG